MSSTSEFSDEILEAGRILCAGPVSFVLGAASLNQLPDADRPEIAFAGRSNVGKSSLINALLNRKGLARASSEPGRTRELNYFDLGDGKFWVVDLPGFGYAKVSKEQARKWVSLSTMSLLDKAAVTYQIVLTKSDKIKASELASTVEKVQNALKKHGAAHPIVRITSAEKGFGLPELRAEIAQLSGG